MGRVRSTIGERPHTPELQTPKLKASGAIRGPVHGVDPCLPNTATTQAPARERQRVAANAGAPGCSLGLSEEETEGFPGTTSVPGL